MHSIDNIGSFVLMIGYEFGLEFFRFYAVNAQREDDIFIVSSGREQFIIHSGGTLD